MRYRKSIQEGTMINGSKKTKHIFTNMELVIGYGTSKCGNSSTYNIRNYLHRSNDLFLLVST